MKKSLSFVLAIFMILSALLAMVACQVEPDDPNNKENPDTPSTENRIPTDYLPTERFGTAENPQQFNILTWTAGADTEPGTNWMPWEEVDVTKMDGDRLGEEVFNRNAQVEARYGVEITREIGAFAGTPDFNTAMTTDALDSEGRYQLYVCRALNIILMLKNEFLYDMNRQAGYLHTDQPWWVADSVTSYTLGDSLYAACTEMLLRDKGATSAMFFNKRIAKDYEQLPDFYELVNSEKWTMAAMIEACELVTPELSGDGAEDPMANQYGLVGADDPLYYFFNAFGYKWAHINEKGYVEYDFGVGETGGGMMILQEIYEEIMYADWYFNKQLRDATLPEGKEMFRDGRSLFYSGMLKHTVTRMNTMQEEYGILPHPMYDETQGSYHSMVWMHHDSIVAIPQTVTKTTGAKLSAVILEALSWESYYSVSPVFYEEILYARAAKDAPDKEMVKLVLDCRSYDPGLYYDGGSGMHSDGGYLRLTKTGSTDVASVYGDFGDLAKKYIGQINNLVDGKPYDG